MRAAVSVGAVVVILGTVVVVNAAGARASNSGIDDWPRDRGGRGEGCEGGGTMALESSGKILEGIGLKR